MTVIHPAHIRGLKVEIPNEARDLFIAHKECTNKNWTTLRFEKTITEESLTFRDNTSGKLCVGIGAIYYLAKTNPAIHFRFDSICPTPRPPIYSEPIIPPAMVNSPKWTVNGKERYYFHEALGACFNKPCGSIKLPTGSGKTEIQLVLALNQKTYIGSGVILVSSRIIYDQFVKRAASYGITLYDYRNALKNQDYQNIAHKIYITTSQVLLNDITNKIGTDLHSKLSWIIADEAHHAKCSTWGTILMSLPNLTRVHGFSALPITKNTNVPFHAMSYEDALTISMIGPVLYAKSSNDLRDFLNLPNAIDLRFSWSSKDAPKVYQNDWVQIQKITANNKERNQYIRDTLITSINLGYSSILHVGLKNLGDELLKLCDSRVVCWYGGGLVKYADGRTISTDQLREKFGGEIKAIIATSHAIEGLDLDNPIDCVILVEGKSARQIIQKVGRSVRPSNRKSLIINLQDSNIGILKKHHKNRAESLWKEFGVASQYSLGSLSELSIFLGKLNK